MHIETIDEKKSYFLEKMFRISKSYGTRRAYDVALNKFEEFLRVKYNLDMNQTLKASIDRTVIL